jgi:hypothetical protein
VVADKVGTCLLERAITCEFHQWTTIYQDTWVFRQVCADELLGLVVELQYT